VAKKPRPASLHKIGLLQGQKYLQQILNRANICKLCTAFNFRKKTTFPPQLLQKFAFPTRKPKPGKPPPSSFQTVCFTSLESSFDGNFVSFFIYFG
jgi:hypothetical protein